MVEPGIKGRQETTVTTANVATIFTALAGIICICCCACSRPKEVKDYPILQIRLPEFTLYFGRVNANDAISPYVRYGSSLFDDNVYVIEGSSRGIDDFYCLTTEVYQGLFKDVMGYNPSYNDPYPESKCLRHPVQNLTYSQCKEFCDRLSERVGVFFHVPDVDEWSFASACSEDEYHDDIIDCGSTISNKYHLYDMKGNVWEFAYGGEMICGGSYMNGPDSYTAVTPMDCSKAMNVGFRIVCYAFSLEEFIEKHPERVRRSKEAIIIE